MCATFEVWGPLMLLKEGIKEEGEMIICNLASWEPLRVMLQKTVAEVEWSQFPVWPQEGDSTSLAVPSSDLGLQAVGLPGKAIWKKKKKSGWHLTIRWLCDKHTPPGNGQMAEEGRVLYSGVITPLCSICPVARFYIRTQPASWCRLHWLVETGHAAGIKLICGFVPAQTLP